MNEEVNDDVLAAQEPAAVPEIAPSQVTGTNPKHVAMAAVLSYIAFSFLVPLIPMPRLHGLPFQIFALVSTLVTTLVFMFLQLWMPRAIVALRPSVPKALGILLLCVAAWSAVNVLHPHRGYAPEANYTLAVVRSAAMGVVLTLGLTYLGTILSRIIREANVLLPVAFVAMPIDYIGAMTPTGYTADMVKHHPNIVQNVSVSVPVMHGLHAIGFIGPGDVLFIAFFLAVAVNLNLNEASTFRLMYIFLTATMLLVFGLQLNIAALVPMGLAVLAANYKHFRLQRSEVFASLYAMIIVLVLVVAFYLYSHHHLFGGK